MKLKQAKELLMLAPLGDKPSKVNPGLTMSQVVDIVRKGIVSEHNDNDEAVLTDLSEKRVYQVVKNQRRPRYQ